jgi:uncharacterized protein YgiB involved in biofilm formation
MSQQTKRRVSKTLPLMLVTSAAVVNLTGCGEDDPNAHLATVRDEYKSLEDCIEDWGSSVPCEPQKTPEGSSSLSNTGNTSGGHTYTGHYFGPTYYDGQRDLAQRNFLGSRYNGNVSHLSDRAVSRSVTRSVSRGGFGSSSRGFSGGG